MRSSMIALTVVLGLAGWHMQDVAKTGHVTPIRTAYDDAAQRYDSGTSLQRESSPQRAQPVAVDAEATGVDNGRLAEGGGAEQTGVDNGRLAQGGGAEQTGVENARYG